MASVGVVLLYHRIASLVPDIHDLCVPPAHFRAHMDHLRRRYRVMPLEDLARAAADRAIPERAVAVTLDDCSIDALETASPILLEAGVPATFFATSERLDGGHEFWWDTLERILLSEEPVPPRLELVLDRTLTLLPTATAVERASAHRLLHQRLVGAAREEREATMGRLVRWRGAVLPPRASHRPLAAEELARLGERPGHAIGAHTIHHLSLPAQPPAVRDEEVAGNKRHLEAVLGRPVTAFAYPYGSFDEPTVDVVRRAGFRTAVTVQERAVASGADGLRLPRFALKGDGERFAAALGRIFAGAPA